ncbi:hypothetical protein NQ315_007870 [Exocentrus adspersus]|uniref:PBZ-type domain-containing protein n=1 Tax=Exocentrus adspersus TaxID=1586481 RepID=A0AAV8W9V8_9CUCU|nr:hypothetical protein NQ315_007870 [Exocentrus adspersus]
MSDTEAKRNKYDQDPRTPCKYGAKCYQQNPVHHKKYKHPPQSNSNKSRGHVNKKFRADTPSKKAEAVVTSNDVSDTDGSDYAIEDGSDASPEKPDVESKGDSNKDGSDASSGKADPESKDDSNKAEVTTCSKDLTEVRISNDVSSSEDSSDANEQTDNVNTVQKPDHKQFIKDKFLVDMPKDFYQLWEYCKKIKPSYPLDALKDVGLRLVGPFDVLAGKFDDVSKSDEEYLLHWRYYHDPPEFQTVLKGDDKTGYHIGYFRDSPDEPPVFLASNRAKVDGILQQMGGNIFTAVNLYLDELKKIGDPFKRMHIGRIQSSIKKEAEKLKLYLSARTPEMIAREKKIVTRTFNKIGLVVPYNRKTQLGYRALALDNKDLSTLFTKLQNGLPEQKQKYLSELQPVFTFASIAADECDFGTGIELGWNIISHGVDSLDSTALRFLATNNRLLNREAFAKIAEAHMKNRKKGCDLSII